MSSSSHTFSLLQKRVAVSGRMQRNWSASTVSVRRMILDHVFLTLCGVIIELLLSNFLEALPIANVAPKRVMLQTGAKNYG